MKQLIINADDFGMSHEFNVAIGDLLENCHISSASLMANGCAYDEAVEIIRSKKLVDIGVHLTFTRENFDNPNKLLYRSLTCRSSISDGNGLLYPIRDYFAKYATDADIIEEIISQIMMILHDGIDITHIDNHMYSLMPHMGYRGYHLFFNAYQQLDIKRKIGVRIASSYYTVKDINYIWSGRKLKPYLWWKMLYNNLIGVDYSFAFPYYAPNHPTLESKRELLHFFLATLREGCTELHLHPAVYSVELEAQNPYWLNRVHEYELLKELYPEQLLQRYGIELISYKRLR